jgi:hypothetical protein
MIIDHPHLLRQVVDQTGAFPTHSGAETLLTDCSGGLDRYAAAYGKLADELWGEQVSSAPIASGKGIERDGVPNPARPEPNKSL